MCSYCLVIYYHNYISYNSDIVTVLCNPIGDVGILITIKIIIIILILVIITAITKRAQIFFSDSLAITAPTPVSALVHSSTLFRLIAYYHSGFYRKDIIIEIIYRKRGINIFMFIINIMSLLLTECYSVRLFYYLLFN
ncbi:NU5M oxidoreductase, partial [Acromyrmex charruanus]